MSEEKPRQETHNIKKTSVLDGVGSVRGADQDKEVGGFENRPEPTRYGDWDVNGRCSDF